MAYKAVIFDFDGVIGDTEELGKRVTRMAGHEFTDEEFKAHHDGNVHKEPVIKFTQDSAQLYFDYYDELILTSSPFQDVHSIKDGLRDKKKFIISSNIECAINKFLPHHDLDIFDRVLGVETHPSKVEKFHMLFSQFQLEPRDCIFVTDTLGDIKASKKVNVPCIAVDFGFHDRNRLEQGEPEFIASNYGKIVEICNRRSDNR